MKKDEYPRPAYTADNVIILIPDNEDVLEEILLIKRGNEPFLNGWALPGGYVNLGETSEIAARREAKEEIGIELGGLPQLVGVFDVPGRDPRGWTVTVVYKWYLPYFRKNEVFAGDDAKEAKWFKLDEIPKDLAFDHLEIIRKAIKNELLWR